MWCIYALRPSSLIVPLLYAAVGHSFSSNRSIDDQKGDNVTGAVPIFTPVNVWNIGQTCVACAVHPGTIDPAQAFEGTWHDATHYILSEPNITVQVDFTGTAVYMYNILVNTVTNVSRTKTVTQLHFFLDGDPVGSFTHEPDESTQVIYNALVYKNTTLPNSPHSLRAVLSGSETAISLFDYALYTVEDDGTQPPSQSSTSLLPSSSSGQPSEAQDNHSNSGSAVIIGGVVGGVVALIAVVLALFLLFRCRTRRRRLESPSQDGPVPMQGRSEMSALGLAASPYVVARVALPPDGPSSKPHLMRDDGLPHVPPPTSYRDPGSAVDTFSIAPEPSAFSSTPERSAYLEQQIQVLQTQVDELRSARGAAAGAATSVASSDVERSLSAVLGAFRTEMAALRAELGEQHYGMGSTFELPPSYGG